MTDYGIVPGEKYRLTEVARGRGTHHEVYAGWDYALLTSEDGYAGEEVVIHQRGDGFAFQNIECNWGGYQWWAMSTTGIYLADEGKATTWYLEGPEDGFYIRNSGKNYLTYPCDGKKWLQALGSVMPNFREFCKWKVVRSS
ncbi:hypothetical protein [Streptomyces sp. HNM0574]|uniref:hypothetical protein n=1 Tax=Streptomyces sp. HNM0574 TaxID=2714954 RepID=UPI00146E0E6A|nr:hypothetical protein [Streptomyces sp. HNM0574]NLU65961.1 hypothetical protein [Streptomyces sp. HNM0574]